MPNRSSFALKLALVCSTIAAATAATNVILTSSANPTTVGARIALTATVDPVLRGRVQFFDEGLPIGIAAVNDGVATLNIRLQRTGNRKLQARYLGAPGVPAGDSAVLRQTVQASAGFNFVEGWTAEAFGTELSIADLNGDTRPDLVSLSSFQPIFSLLGRANGAFDPFVQYHLQSYGETRLVLGDFDGNGRPDAAYVTVQDSGPASTVSVRFGQGDGSFGQPIKSNAAKCTEVTSADFNRDGLADIACADPRRGAVSIYLSKGSGVFEPEAVYSVVSGEAVRIAVEAADANGDGLADIVFAISLANRILVGMLVGAGDGSFAGGAPPSAYELPDRGLARFAPRISIGDLNGDGRADLVLQSGPYVILRSAVAVFLAHSGNGFGEPMRYVFGLSPSYPSAIFGAPAGIVVGDFTGDGYQDVVAMLEFNDGYVFLFPGTAEGVLRESSLVGIIDAYPSSLIAADLNDDGRLDLATGGGRVQTVHGAASSFLRGTLHPLGDWRANQNVRLQVSIRNENLAAPATGPISVSIADFNPTSMTGDGWTCTGACTRRDTLPAGAQYPPIVIDGRPQSSVGSTVNVRADVFGSGGYPFSVSASVPLIPALAKIVPEKAATGVNTEFSLVGGVFEPETIAIEIGGVAISKSAISLRNSNELKFTAQLPAGTYSVAVKNGSGGKTSNRLEVRVTDPVPVELPTRGSLFVPITPCRAADTRSATAIAAGNSRNFTFANCGVPAGATAVAINVTLVPTGSLGYLSLWPTGQAQPPVSTMNSLDGRIKANAAIVGLGSNGAVSIYVTDAAHVALDVNGYFVPPGSPGGLAFYPMQPCRVVDTRTAGIGGRIPASSTRRISGGCLPAQAQAYSLNVTTVPPGPLGFLTLWPDGSSQPTVSTLNNLTGTVVANAAILRAGTGGAFNAFVTDASDLVVDVNGYFAPPGSPGALQFYPIAPCRVIDTRSGTGQFVADSSRQFTIPESNCGIPASSQAYVTNATVLPNGVFGFLTLWPAGVSRPTVSTLNAVDGALTSNAAIVPAGPGGAVNLYTSNSGHVLLDISGYFAP